MLAIAGGKGGCGKTTTTLGVASALARQRRSVLAADADREMPNLHAMAGVSRRPGLDAVAAGWPARAVAGRPSASGVSSGVRVLPAASGPTRGGPAEGTEGLALAGLRAADAADAVLLDSPAGAGPDAVAPLRVADAAVVATTAEPACLRDAAKTAAMARELGTPVAGAVVSRAVGPECDGAEPNPPEGIADLLDCPVLGVVPEVGSAPLADDRVRAAHDRLVSALQPKYL
ncbi:P-loop NTPase [Halorussus salilacus]|uniref:MinD/ParA family ATP-binding protein n=1 Tax=Halorussus salilacus TaxID=2953750 RepID=UPI0020A03152|nr:P-loop NTPase [Halorussus salilacus]USZ67977.1 P-loop NTPase [Halorussus salilacus]